MEKEVPSNTSVTRSERVAETQKTGVRESLVDVVYFNESHSMPRYLYRRSRRIIRLLLGAGLSPLILLMFYMFTPTVTLMALAEPINHFFWAYIKSVSLENCSAKCSLVAFTMIAVPVSWGASIVLGIVAIPLTVQFRNAQVEALRQGFAPIGKMPDGAAKPLRNATSTARVVIPTMALYAALLIAIVYGLYGFGGSDRTIYPRTGREFSLGLVVVVFTVLMSAAQFGATFIMFLATDFVLSLKSALRI